jgi:hypothetical protein
MIILHPTAGTHELDAVPNLVEAWQEMLQKLTDFMLFAPSTGREQSRAELSAVEELKVWGRDRRDIRYYDPLTMPFPAGSSVKNVHWGALPTSFDQDPRFGGDQDKIFEFLDAPQDDVDENGNPGKSRQQDEYCEWAVKKSGGKITRVIFTSEPALFYQFLFDPQGTIQGIDPTAPDPGVDRAASQKLLVEIYRTRTGDATVQLADLIDGQGNYTSFNRWNSDFAVHLQQRNNTLGAEINIAVRSSLLRAQAGTGPLKQDAADLIACGAYGEGARQSDPTIGAAVNSFARDNKFLTLADPVGLYMTGLDTTGWSASNGADPQSFWTVLAGHGDPDPEKAMIVRAEFAVGPATGFTVSDIKIGGTPITFGAQIANGIGMRLGALVGPVSSLPAPRPIGCVTEAIPAHMQAHLAAAAARPRPRIQMSRRSR